MTRVATTSDYFWRADRYDWNFWVTARKQGLDAPKRIFGNGFIDEVLKGDKKFIDLLRRLKVQEVWPDYMKGHSKELFD